MSEQEDDTHELIARALVSAAKAAVAGAHKEVLRFDKRLMKEGYDRPPTLVQYLSEHFGAAPDVIHAHVDTAWTYVHKSGPPPNKKKQREGSGRPKNRHNRIRDLWIAGLMHELITQQGLGIDAAARAAIKAAPGRAWHLYQEMREQIGCSEEEAARAAVRTLGDAARRRLNNILVDDGKRGLPHSPERALRTVLEDWRKAKRGASMAKKSALAAYAEFFGN